jgi:hypothetical protein
MHLDEEQVQRLLHDEVGSSEALLRDHVATCLDCRRQVAAAEKDEAEIEALLLQIDSMPPRVDVDRLIAAAGSRPVPAGSTVRRPRLAAGILLALAVAGAAYALPGSPVRGWIRQVVVSLQSGEGQPEVPPEATRSADPGAGIAIDPGMSLRIEFSGPTRNARARVTLTDANQVLVRSAAGAATFTAEPERLGILVNRDSVLIEIEIPRTAPWVEIRVGGRSHFLKRGARVTAAALVANDSSYLLHLVP